MFDERLFRETRDGLPSLLRYEDRNSMAHSIEARVPFLDHRLVELAFEIAGESKIVRGVTKDVLREAMRGTLPDRIRTRSDKMGFVTPETTWFQSRLGDHALDVLAQPPDAVADLVDIDQISALARTAKGEPIDPYAQTTVWRVVNACDWIERFGLTS